MWRGIVGKGRHMAPLSLYQRKQPPGGRLFSLTPIFIRGVPGQVYRAALDSAATAGSLRFTASMRRIASLRFSAEFAKEIRM